MRVASLEDTLRGKIKAWREAERRQSKKLKDLGDIARLVESHPHLWEMLDPDLKRIDSEAVIADVRMPRHQPPMDTDGTCFAWTIRPRSLWATGQHGVSPPLAL